MYFNISYAFHIFLTVILLKFQTFLESQVTLISNNSTLNLITFANETTTSLIPDKSTKVSKEPDLDYKQIGIRVLYVLSAVGAIVIVYFIYRCLRKHHESKSRKYGLITTQEYDMELSQIDQEDEDEDLKVFDRSLPLNKYSKSNNLTNKSKNKTP